MITLGRLDPTPVREHPYRTCRLRCSVCGDEVQAYGAMSVCRCKETWIAGTIIFREDRPYPGNYTEVER